MSKIETKVKSMNAGDLPASESSNEISSDKAKLDSFESKGGSKWKAMGLSTTSFSGMEGLSEGLSDFSDILGATINNGVMGAAPIVRQSPFIIRINKTVKDQYTEKLEAIELPPSALETVALLPETSEGRSASIKETCVHYDEFIALCAAQKETAVNAMKNSTVSASDAAILQQYIEELNKAAIFAEEQKAAIKSYKG